MKIVTTDKHKAPTNDSFCSLSSSGLTTAAVAAENNDMTLRTVVYIVSINDGKKPTRVKKVKRASICTSLMMPWKNKKVTVTVHSLDPIMINCLT